MFVSNCETRNEARRNVRLMLSLPASSNCQGTSWQKTTFVPSSAGQDPVADRFGSGADESDRTRIAIVHIGRADSGKDRATIERLEIRGDVLGVLHADLKGQEGLRVICIEPDPEHAAAGLEPPCDRLRVPGQFFACAGAGHEHLIGRQVGSLERSHPETGSRKMAQPGRIAGVNDRSSRHRASARHVADDILHQRSGHGVALGSAGHVKLAEQDETLALPVFH